MPVATRGRELWLVAGQQLLRRGGDAAVKLQALTDELQLTTGSFYHHFGGMAEYLDHLARYYGREQVLSGTAALAGEDPRARLRGLYDMSLDDEMGPLDAAMRDWAGHNPVAAKAVRDADAVLLRFIEQAFVDLGYDTDAPVRAHLLFSAGVARITPPWRIGPNPFDNYLAVLAP